ncbi:MAG TPA: hypothetical protein P5532_20590 [Planctomycetota bacterium]|nr:hypothetical protein [Planctomycetota bacterium]HRT96826.1 hypothetical protein [Planctomycetota bacterium]
MSVPRSVFGLPVVATMAVLLAQGAAFAGATDIVGRDRYDNRERKPSRYYVFQVMGVSGAVTFEVVSDLDARERQKEYDEEYKKAGNDWLKAKYEAKKRKEEFTEPPPKGPKLMRKMPESFRKEEDARAAAEKLQKQWDEALEKKSAKEAEEKAAKADK